MRRLRSEEQGATIVFIALIIVVLLGLVGFAVDTGALYDERRQLQNGADAAALAVAGDCGRGLDSCKQSPATATADSFADLNANDGAAGIESLVIDFDQQTVRVVTHTETKTGGTEFEPFFMQVLGMGGTRVKADATARWGSPKRAFVLPLAISHCEWNWHYAPAANPPPLVSLYTHGHNPDEVFLDCSHVNAGFDGNGDNHLEGGFGWIRTGSGSDCELYLQVSDEEDPEESYYYPGLQGSAPPQDCRDLIEITDGGTNRLFIPIYEDLCRIGDNIFGTDQKITEEDCPLWPELDDDITAASLNRYALEGFAIFDLVGYQLPGLRYNSTCQPGEFCLQGHFASGVIPAGEFSNDPPIGLVLVQLID